MPCEFHDTAHADKRARERRLTLEEATLTVNESHSIPKTPPRRGNQSGMNRSGRFVIPITEPPVVEIDTAATAVYVRLREGRVARTEPYGSAAGLVMLDFDTAGAVIGIEIVGQMEHSIRTLIAGLPMQAGDDVLNRTRYVSAELQAA